MKTREITTLLVFLYIMTITIGYYVIEYSNITNMQLVKENEYLNERVQKLLTENEELRQEIITLTENSVRISPVEISFAFMIFAIFIFITLKTQKK